VPVVAYLQFTTGGWLVQYTEHDVVKATHLVVEASWAVKRFGLSLKKKKRKRKESPAFLSLSGKTIGLA
jgi:hypothetical protein